MTEPAAIEPETKDRTWDQQRRCPECGFDAMDVDRHDLGRIVRDNAVGWERVLVPPAAATRPEPKVWWISARSTAGSSSTPSRWGCTPWLYRTVG